MSQVASSNARSSSSVVTSSTTRSSPRSGERSELGRARRQLLGPGEHEKPGEAVRVLLELERLTLHVLELGRDQLRPRVLPCGLEVQVVARPS